ncbi:hypothetical protein QR680_015399 [Steinernema hermaphroditum]|uniref:Uncharacterized protein n=1 Tax=Steinernema hermaphroditum TaxID=289476 RepID=A0AA39H7I3_9BILA|nr:hypothetical protein QR680_015399 [Steinernema hermaphroditum]
MDSIVPTISSVDLLLEPYYLYLIIFKSSPAMKVCRLLLGAISAFNLCLSLVFAVWSPEFSIKHKSLCFSSRIAPPEVQNVFLKVANTVVYAQAQLLLVLLIYGSLKLSSLGFLRKLPPSAIVVTIGLFTIGPSIFALQLFEFQSLGPTCIDFSPKPPFVIFISGFSLFLVTYLALAWCAISRITEFSKTFSRDVTPDVVRMVRNVLRNFLLAMVLVSVFLILPLFLFALFSVISATEAPKFVIHMGTVSVVLYSSLSTITSICTFRPYRTHTLKMIRTIWTTLIVWPK